MKNTKDPWQLGCGSFYLQVLGIKVDTMESLTIENFLKAKNEKGEASHEICTALIALCSAATKIAKLAAANGIGTDNLGSLTGAENTDGDEQKALDVIADQLICSALASTGVGAYLSEERDEAVIFEGSDSQMVVASDPLDGSSNIDTNLTIGTIFSLYPAEADNWLREGRSQQAAGFFAYGPQTVLLITTGQGVDGFCLNEEGQFIQMDWQPKIPTITKEFAINSANSRYWPAEVKRYIDSLLAGVEGPRGKNFNMRWNGSLVADAFRIFRRGGIFLYPQDSRKNYENGRLRLVYEANPIAFLVEQAGGRAMDGKIDILDIAPTSHHMRVPLIFGSADEVDSYHSEQ